MFIEKKIHISCLVERDGGNPKKRIIPIQFVLELDTPSSFIIRIMLRYPWNFRGSYLGKEEIVGKNVRLWFEGMH